MRGPTCDTIPAPGSSGKKPTRVAGACRIVRINFTRSENCVKPCDVRREAKVGERHLIDYFLEALTTFPYFNIICRQEGPEAHHKLTWQFVRLTFNGGASGNPFEQRRTQAGTITYNKDLPKRWIYKRPVSMAVMETQARWIHHQYNHHWPISHSWPPVSIRDKHKEERETAEREREGGRQS
jgi:hypothetical protein